MRPLCVNLTNDANKFFALFLVLVMFAMGASSTSAQEKRARPPKFDDSSYRGVFYDRVDEALQGDRPRVSALSNLQNARAVASSGGGAPSSSASAGSTDGGGNKWAKLAKPVHLEDEVKRLKLRFDETVTTPGRFRSGDFQQARTELAMLATVFAVISEYQGDIRFKEDAAIARDLMSRSVQGVSSGSDDAFDQAKQRKADLQDIVTGTGLNRASPTEPNDWSYITTRTALMEYLEVTVDDPLNANTNDAESIEDAMDDLQRAAAMVAVVGQVLTEEGMDGADDPDYNALSLEMTKAALDLRFALDQNDAEAARLAVGAIGQSCDNCHGEYR